LLPLVHAITRSAAPPGSLRAISADFYRNALYES
jgi:hypothetical protein